MSLLAIIFPGLSFLIRGKIILAILAFILQLTIIGWLPVAIWAVVSLNDSRNDKRVNDMECRILNLQNNSK
jgi:TM2 domain-containing membrane protein YozV